VRVNASDKVDYAFTGIGELTSAGHRLLKRTQTGSLRWYASGLAVGSALFLLIVLFTR
jgi:NADH-quinone oxidoreductase subunit L